MSLFKRLSPEEKSFNEGLKSACRPKETCVGNQFVPFRENGQWGLNHPLIMVGPVSQSRFLDLQTRALKMGVSKEKIEELARKEALRLLKEPGYVVADSFGHEKIRNVEIAIMMAAVFGLNDVREKAFKKKDLVDLARI